MLTRFSSFFKEEAVSGLDIGEGYITAACLSFQDNGGIKIDNMGWIENQPGLSDRATASLIKRLWRKSRIITNTVSFALHGPSLVMKHFKYPSLTGQELESSLRLEAEQAFQKPQEELYIDWHLYTQSSGSQKGQGEEGVLVAAPKEVVDKYLSILKMAGLYPVILDAGCMAVSSLFLKVKDAYKNKAVCLVNIDGHSVDFTILSQGSYIYPRSIHSSTAPWQERTNNLIEDINDILRYYQFKLQRQSVEKLIFTGQGSFDKKFQEDIRKNIALGVEFWNPLKDIAFKKGISREEIETYGPIMATSIGLAMRKE